MVIVHGARVPPYVSNFSDNLSRGMLTDGCGWDGHLIGNGILALVQRGAGFEALFTNEELGFYSDFDDLVNVIRTFRKDDDLRCHVAERMEEGTRRLFVPAVC